MQLVRELIDTGVLLLLCLVAAFAFFPDMILAAPFLITLAVLAFQLYTEREAIQLGLIALFVILCFPFPALLLFVPVLVYSSCRIGQWRWLCVLLLPGYYSLELLSPGNLVFTAVACGVAVLLQKRSWMIESFQSRYFSLLDESRLLNDQLESRQQELLEQQDNEIHLATMNERNRIARDIHDNVGHLLSSALLQTAALRTTSHSDPIQLDQLQITLNQAMNSVRESVHQLHETSINLEQHILRLVDGFSYCTSTCSIDIYSEPDKEQRYVFISIVKESLSNIMKHSQASELVLRLREHPGFYQLQIENNGVEKNLNSGVNSGVNYGLGEISCLENMLNKGIGLRSMQERVESMGGQFRLDIDERFRLFISLPKK